MATSSVIGFDLPSVSNILNFSEKLTYELLELKKNQLLIKLKNGEITKSQYNNLLAELSLKPIYGTSSTIPENINNLVDNPSSLQKPIIKSLISLKPRLISRAESIRTKKIAKIVGINTTLTRKDVFTKSFSPRLINWVEPYTIKGVDKTLFYTEVNSGLKKGDRVFIVNGNYDSDLLIKKDKYKKGRDGYKILEIDNCKIVLDINYTGVMPYNDEELDDFIKVHYIRDRHEFIQVNRELTTREGVLTNKFDIGQNNIAFFSKSYRAFYTQWGDSTRIPTSGFYVRDSSTQPAQWINITTEFLSGSFSYALSPTYFNNNRVKVLRGTFYYQGKFFQEDYVYKWDVGPVFSDWKVDVTYHRPLITKTNFRDGNFDGKWNTGLFGRQDKQIIWDGTKSTWKSGTLLNSLWKKGTLDSEFSLKESFIADFDKYGMPYQKANVTNNNGRGFNYIIDSKLENSVINNGSVINTTIGNIGATYSIVENHLISATTSFNNIVNLGYFEKCYINSSQIRNSEVANSRSYNTRFLRVKSVNSKFFDSVIKDSTILGDDIIKIENYDEWSATEFKPSRAPSNKVYKFYISRSSYERLKNSDAFYIKGLAIRNNSKDVINFFDKKFFLSSRFNYSDRIRLDNAPDIVYKSGTEYVAYLSTPKENENKFNSYTTNPGNLSSTIIVDANEKAGYSLDIIIKTSDTFYMNVDEIDYNRENTATLATMSRYIGDIIDISNAYILDSDFESGLIETSNWYGGNHINSTNDTHITDIYTYNGNYNIRINSTASSTLVVSTGRSGNSTEVDDFYFAKDKSIFLNSVYYEVTNYVSSVEILTPGTGYTSQSDVFVYGVGLTGYGLSVNIVAPTNDEITNVTVANAGTGYSVGDELIIAMGNYDATIRVTSVTTSRVLLPNDYKIVEFYGNGDMVVQEVYKPGSTSIISTLRDWGRAYTPDAQNRWGYLYRTKFLKSKIKSGIFRTAYFQNSLIEAEDFNPFDKDYQNLKRVRNLVISDAMFRDNANILSNATYLHSHFIKGNNIWTNGISQKSIWNGLTFSNGMIKESRWVDGTFNSGLFYSSNSFNANPNENERNHYTENIISYYKDGLVTSTISNDRWSWQKGTFKLDTKDATSEFVKSDWEDGTFLSGKFYNSKWYDGFASGGVFGESAVPAEDTIFYNGTASNLIVENASFYASDTSYEKSTSKVVSWLGGIFNDGIFGTNYQQITASNVATWYDGEFNGGQFISLAKWKKGTFNGGKFISGLGWTQSDSASQSQYTWEDGIFNGGEFGNANGLTNSTWWFGQFNDGIFKGRVWNNGLFRKGKFDGSATWSSVGPKSKSAQSFVSSFASEYFGLWRDGFFTDQKDRLIKDKKVFTKLERVENELSRKTYNPASINNALWLNGTFSHQSGETNNVVWMDGTFEKGKFYASSFNPYVSRSSNQNLVWSYDVESNLLPNSGLSPSTGWIDSVGVLSSFRVISGEAIYNSPDGTKHILSNNLTNIYEGEYEVTFTVKTFSSTWPLSLYAAVGNTSANLYPLIIGITSSDLGVNKKTITVTNKIVNGVEQVVSGYFGLYGSVRTGSSGYFVLDDITVKRRKTQSFNLDDTCIWEDGRFENGDFHISKWMKGNFIIGTGYGMIWKNGTSNYMNAFNIFWEDGLWRNGNWYGSGIEYNGTVKDPFDRELLYRGMSWSGTSSCHLWNIFDTAENLVRYNLTASNPYFDNNITD